ncbi:hypothetical protein AMECASPLE_002853 [Ameca splendens]|uniref:Uncharacterized protein n=1 Tax=Ameca splendens TaxID=208324 RepID=A0ABV0Z793_9TELE
MPSRRRFPVLESSIPQLGRCTERSCWWRWVGAALTERGPEGRQMPQSGGLDPDLGGAAQQKVETGMPEEILSYRRACQRDAPPVEKRPYDCKNSLFSFMSLIFTLFKREEEEERL